MKLIKTDKSKNAAAKIHAIELTVQCCLRGEQEFECMVDRRAETNKILLPKFIRQHNYDKHGRSKKQEPSVTMQLQ